jgi:L-fuculose-phosphate aldolase
MYPQPISSGRRKSEEEHRRVICAAGRRLAERGFVPAASGNLSIRLDDERILTTPTGVCKGTLEPQDLVVMDLEGRKLSGDAEPSSEVHMHLLFYWRRPDVQAVCHAHPPAATGFAAAGLPIGRALLGEAVIALGPVPLAAFATPGTREMAEALEPFVERHDAILLANHGVVTCGADLTWACYRMEIAEHCAMVSLVTHMLGRQELLSRENVEKLLAARGHYGLGKARPGETDELMTSDDERKDDVVMTRNELGSLIEEAIRRDRARR